MNRETRPFYWSIRRELWENRFLYVAPLLVMALVLFSSVIAVIHQSSQGRIPIGPFRMAPAPIMLSTFIIALFYSIDALYTERRDRSILFWKSLPVSDLTTVLSKVSVPLLVLPAIALVLAIATQLILLVVSAPIQLVNGLNPAELWDELDFFEEVMVMFYGLGVHVLWFAPIYGWLMLVSAWARRAPLLWAVLPFLAIAAVERIIFGSMHFMSALGYRVTGAMRRAFANAGEHNLDITPLRFLATPGLWFGLAFAAAFFAAAVRLRRDREPI